MFSLMNTWNLHHNHNAIYYYDSVSTAPGSRASDCVRCGKCEAACPQHLPIRELLEQVAAELEQED